MEIIPKLRYNIIKILSSVIYDLICIFILMKYDFTLFIIKISENTIINTLLISLLFSFLLLPILFFNLIKLRLINNFKLIRYSFTITVGLFFITYCYMFLKNDSTFFVGLYLISLFITNSYLPNTVFGEKLINEYNESIKVEISSEKNIIDKYNHNYINEPLEESYKIALNPDINISKNLLILHVIESYYSSNFDKCISYCNLFFKNFGYHEIVLIKRAESLEKLKYLYNAIKDYELHLDIFGKNPNINGLIGSLYLQIGMNLKAFENLSIAIKEGCNQFLTIYKFAKISINDETVMNFEFENSKKNGLHDLIDISTFLSADVGLENIETISKRALSSLSRKRNNNNINEAEFELLSNYIKKVK